MHCCLRQRKVLVATIHSNLGDSIDMTAQTKKAVEDIEDDNFWKALYFILSYVWPALCALRLGDSNKPGMHMIY